MNQNISNILSSLPHSPGVYQYFDAQGKIIYVGKSKNLKSRVNSYFKENATLNFAKKQMIHKICNIKYIVTNTETESLILENDLIKKYQPKYNILLKDDKNFLYIKITKEKYPKVVRTRISPSNIKKSDGQYFGPYISGYHVQEIFKLLKKVFGYGVGAHNFFLKKGSYNLDKYIFSGNISASETIIKARYDEKIGEIAALLSGKTHELKEKLKQEMLEKAKNLEFEEAQKRKVSLEALASLEEGQIVRDGVKGDYNIIQVLDKYEKSFVGMIEIRQGKITAYENLEVENILEEDQDTILKNIVEQKWLEDYNNGDKISFILPKHINTLPEISIEIPELGAKYELLKLCYKNIYEYAHKQYMQSLSTKSFTKKNMQNILQLLGYTQINTDIIFECNDISHLSGNHTVASRSVIENGKKATGKYKKYRIKTLQEGKIDDFDSMREVTQRRIAELQKLGNYPDLVVIDGGKGQLSAVMEIYEAYPEVREKLQIVSLAKREEELFIPDESTPILIDKNSSELRLIQALRDEAHRFAISFNRDSRSSSQKKNILEAIPGIGPKTRKKILNKYGSLSGLQEAQANERAEFLGKKITETLENHGII